MSSPLETTEENVDGVNEYVPYLTSRQHFVDNLDEEEEEDIESIHKTRHRLPLPPKFEQFVHSRSLHQPFINLLPHYEVDFSKPINLFMCNVPLCCNSNRNCFINFHTKNNNNKE